MQACSSSRTVTDRRHLPITPDQYAAMVARSQFPANHRLRFVCGLRRLNRLRIAPSCG